MSTLIMQTSLSMKPQGSF